MRKKIECKKSFLFGGLFFLIIPIFAFIYWFCLPDGWFFSKEILCNSYLDYLYFSIVSITTLGFGEIYPITTCSRIFVSLESILGIICIGLFLNSLSSEHTKKISDIEKKRYEKASTLNELNKLSLRRKMLDVRINRYLLAIYNIVTPICERTNECKIELDKIQFNKMYDMFGITSLLTEDIRTSSLEMFIHKQNELYNEVSDIIKTVDVNYWPELLIPINDFMTNCVNFGFEGSLLGIKDQIIGNNKASIFYSELIKNYDGELELQPSNALNQFIALYKLIIGNYNQICILKNSLNLLEEKRYGLMQELVS